MKIVCRTTSCKTLRASESIRNENEYPLMALIDHTVVAGKETNQRLCARGGGMTDTCKAGGGPGHDIYCGH